MSVPAAETAATPEGESELVVRRPGRKRREQRRLVALQFMVTLLSLALLGALGFFGYRNVLRITGGNDTKVTDPVLPGYTAEVRPTAVDLIAFTSADGSLGAMLLVVDGAGGKGGTVVPLPSTLALWTFEQSPPAGAFSVFAEGGIDALRVRLGAELTFGITGTATVPATAIQTLAEAVGPISFDLADDVRAGTTDENQTVKFPAGPTTLSPEQVVEFLTFGGYREPEANRALRSQQVWELILPKLSVDAFPDLSASAGTGKPTFEQVVRSLLAGDIEFETVPLERMPVNNATKLVLYRIDQAAMPQWVPGVVPFPIAAFPGQRARVRLLRGTNARDALRDISPKVVAAGGEIAEVGNADSFDVATTEVRYGSPDAQPSAKRIADELGVTAVVADEDLSDMDVEVVVGNDLSQ